MTIGTVMWGYNRRDTITDNAPCKSLLVCKCWIGAQFRGPVTSRCYAKEGAGIKFLITKYLIDKVPKHKVPNYKVPN